MRRAECANLQIDDVKFLDDNSGFITVRDSKTGRGRFAAFDDVTGREIRCYLNLWRVKQGPLFFHAGREPLQPLEPGTIHRIIRRAAVRGGVENKYQGCHDIRRAYATFWMRKLPGEGYSWLLARELGHTVTSGMTSYYAKLDHEDIRQCLQTQRCSLFTQLMSQIQRNDSAAQRRRL